jgi:23S rRNA pseudouridine1911/1915/1917 synthase
VPWTVPSVVAGERLVDHLRSHLVVVARRAVGPLIATGAVTVNGVPGAIATPLRGGELVDVDADAIDALVAKHRAVRPVDAPLTTVHHDTDVIAVDVPHGLHVAPTGGHGEDAVTTRLLWQLGARPDHPWAAVRPLPVHRIDRATSGLLLFATSPAIAEQLQQALRAGAMHRTYRAQVEGVVAGVEGVIDAPIGPDPTDGYRRAVLASDAPGAQAARSHWRVESRSATTTRLTLTLETGRTHQLRVHLAHLGHPIIDDALYGAATSTTPVDTHGDAHVRGAIALRAVGLRFPHPTTGVTVELSVSPTPPPL